MFRPPASARMGTGTRLPALRSPPLAAIQPKPRGKAKGGRFHPRLYTKFCVQKIPGQKNTGRGRRGTAPARKTGGNDAQNPLKCHQIAPALTRGGQKEGFPIPNGQQNGRKRAVKCRRAVDRRGMRPFCRRWRHSRDTAANNRRKRRQVLLGKPYGRRRKPRPAGTRPPKSSTPACTSSEWAQLRAACLRPFANPPATSSLTYQPIPVYASFNRKARLI